MYKRPTSIYVVNDFNLGFQLNVKIFMMLMTKDSVKAKSIIKGLFFTLKANSCFSPKMSDISLYIMKV